MPTFFYNDMTIELTHKECIDTEIYLNKVDIEKNFIQLGDKLFEAGRNYENKELVELNVNEYNWIQDNLFKIFKIKIQ